MSMLKANKHAIMAGRGKAHVAPVPSEKIIIQQSARQEEQKQQSHAHVADMPAEQAQPPPSSSAYGSSTNTTCHAAVLRGLPTPNLRPCNLTVC
mmetsp:Transcript_50487/g.100790  ORF Transcript_50487/g.100790 Transcript_50487/m.100790 type:complete len:94 (-) Transcript_50487:1186-1467(-)